MDGHIKTAPMHKTRVTSSYIKLPITTKNYWDVVNEFKPLMHTWYISLLMQTYVVLPLIVKLCTKTKSFLRSCGYSLAAFTAVSFALYLLPVFSDSDKFYFPFFRFFEVTLGAIIAVYSDKLTKAVKKLGASKFAILTTISAIGVASLFVVPDGFKDEILLIGVCIISAMVIIIDLPSEKSGKYPFVLRFIGMFGKITFGVYLWHQIILAFVRYTITTEFSPVHILLYFLFTLFIGFISYYLIEKPISLLCAKGKHGKATVFVCCILLCLLTSVCSLLLYKNAGVVRDIPELDIVKADAHRNMHAEYCDRGYLYDKDFEKPEKINVLVIGVSFARDYINILLESDFSDKLELSYIHTVSPEQVMSHKSRFEQADFILYSISNVKAAGIPSYLDDYYEKGNVYLIGNKSFGNCNGIIYNKRNDEDYLNSSVKIDEAYIKQNKLFSEKYNDHFIDMLTPVMLDDQTVRVFTDDGKFISQDTRHLTRSGAIYYSKLLDFSWLVG